MTTTFLLFLILAGVTETEVHLARAIEGERPDLVSPRLAGRRRSGGLGQPRLRGLAEHIGHVVLNRLDAGWCHSVRECVYDGFWGAEHVLYPQQWALDAAVHVLTYRKERTSEAFYVFSLADCNYLGLSLEDALSVARNEEYGLVFYDRYIEWRKHDNEN